MPKTKPVKTTEVKPEVKTVEVKQAPTLVKIISVFYYIAAFALVIGGIAFLILSTMVSSFGSALGQIPIPFLSQISLTSLLSLATVFVVFFGILFIGIGILFFFIARGLWKVKPWARTAAIILTFLNVLSTIVTMIQQGNLNNILGLLIGIAIGLYLLFDKDVKGAFSP